MLIVPIIPVVLYLGLSPAVTGFHRPALASAKLKHHVQHVNWKILRMTSDGDASKGDAPPTMSAKIAALKAEAAKFRAEAAELESVQAVDRAKAVEDVFRKFDINQDGEISVDELREGLNSIFGPDAALTDDRAEKLLRAFDDSGDGALQLEEFKSINEFRMKLDQLILEEKDAALESQRNATEARQAANLAQEKVKMLEELLNDSPPTTSDKVVSLIPYIFPLVDVIPYGQYLLNKELDSPLVAFVTTVYAIYQAVPFSGLFAFFVLSFLSGNMSLNRIVRFNMQQAIYLDIALFVPGLLGGLATYCIPTFLGIPLTQETIVNSSTLTFLLTSAIIIYCCGSSLAGITPDKVPFISERVEKRVPTADMFDKEGNFVGRQGPGEEEEKGRDEN